MKKFLIIFLVFNCFFCINVCGSEIKGEKSNRQDILLDKDDFCSEKAYNNYIKEAGDELFPKISTRKMAINQAPSTVSTISLYYSFMNLKSGNAIQNFCFKDNNSVYFTQHIGNGNYYLYKGTVHGNTINASECMTILGAGHGQSIEYYRYNNKDYYLIACTNKKVGESYWSTQIGRVEFKNGATVQNENIHRLTYLSYATKNYTNNSNKTIKRCDAALSADNSKMLIWMMNTDGDVYYSCYNFGTVKSQLEKNIKTSFKNNKTLYKALQYSVYQVKKTRVFPQESFQGIEVTNAGNIYQSSGKKTDSPWICKVNKNGTWESTVKVGFSNETEPFEMEGIKIKGDDLYFTAKFDAYDCRIGKILKNELD